MTKVALITGAARRIGKAIAEQLHQQGFNIIIHYRRSQQEAEILCQQLNDTRNHSAVTLKADLEQENYADIIQQALQPWQQLDVLVNNASTYQQTPLNTAKEADWDHLFASNAKAPFFLSLHAAPHLAKTRGCVINIADVNGKRAKLNYSIYSLAKACLLSQTEVLAKELAPHVRVNAIAPGPIIWPEGENTYSEQEQQAVIENTLLKKTGHPTDIAKAVSYLQDAQFVTGQVIAVDGGKVISSNGV